MSLVIRDTSTVPDTGWRYPHVVDGLYIMTRNLQLLYPMVVQVYQSNGKPIPSEDDVIKFICENLFVPCLQDNSPLVNRFTQNRPPTLPSSCCSSGER